MERQEQEGRIEMTVKTKEQIKIGVVLAISALVFVASYWISNPRPAYRIIARDENNCTRYVVQRRLVGGIYRGYLLNCEFSLEDARKRLKIYIENDRRSEVILNAKWRVVE